MRVFFSLMAMLFAATSLAQGTLIFNNRTQSGDAPIAFGNQGFGAFPGAMAQLYLVGPGGTLSPLTPATTFRTSSAAAMFFVTEINPFVIDGILPGQSATVRLRAWIGGPSYEAAVASNGVRGESNDVLIPQLGGTPAGGGAPIPTPSLNGLQGFGIPEPSSITLGMLGAVALIGFRRANQNR